MNEPRAEENDDGEREQHQERTIDHSSSRFHCGWCLNLITYYPQVSFTGIIWLINSFAYTILICGSAIPSLRGPFPSGLGHYDPLSSHEIDGVRKEKERLTAASISSGK